MAELSKTAKASMKQSEEPIRQLQPGEHDHVCPACHEPYTHVDKTCPQQGLAYAPCDNGNCLMWFLDNQRLPRQRPGRHVITLGTAIRAIATMPEPAPLPDIYKPELADLMLTTLTPEPPARPGSRTAAGLFLAMCEMVAPGSVEAAMNFESVRKTDEEE